MWSCCKYISPQIKTTATFNKNKNNLSIIIHTQGVPEGKIKRIRQNRKKRLIMATGTDGHREDI